MERPWTDPTRDAVERVEALLAAMTLDEKLAQLGSVWLGRSSGSGPVAPMQDVFAAAGEVDLTHGIGQLTRVFGSAAADAGRTAAELAALQRRLVDETRLGIPAVAHEECLTGFTTYGATVYPAPPSWAATFDPALVEEMARRIGGSMRAVGVHQGLAPVLDVVRDHRWGRVEETLGEDPYLVAAVGAAYVHGLESTGVVATLKHFAGYSASRAGRNHAPVSMGRRELLDVVLPPFETAVREGGARSVMDSYCDVDGVPSVADRWLLTDVLRDDWGFEGTTVSDYFAIAFLRSMHRVADSPERAGALALAAGMDVELPATNCYGSGLAGLVRSGEVDEALVDRSVRRVLRQKLELGLLDAGWDPAPPASAPAVDLDPPADRALARTLAERSVILLANDGTLPLAAPARVALVGPLADDPRGFLGCYSFPNHVLATRGVDGLGIAVPTLLDALRAELPSVVHAPGVPVRDGDLSGLADAVGAVRAADVAVLAVGDRPGLFGRGTSGEGCDAPDLRLPGLQHELVEAVLAAGADAGVPVVLVVVSGRPYALGAYTERAAAIVQTFLPGEEGGAALAGVLTGRVVPSGRLPLQVPAEPGGSPGTYLTAPLGLNTSGISALDPTPAFPFGHGLSYTTFTRTDLAVGADAVGTDGTVEVACTVTNTGGRAGADVVQLYVEDPVASVVQPATRLVGFARVELEPGAAARVTFTLSTDRLAFVGPDLVRIVEPGEIRLRVARDAADPGLVSSVQVTGPVRRVGADRALLTPARVAALVPTPALPSP